MSTRNGGPRCRFCDAALASASSISACRRCARASCRQVGSRSGAVLSAPCRVCSGARSFSSTFVPRRTSSATMRTFPRTRRPGSITPRLRRHDSRAFGLGPTISSSRSLRTTGTCCSTSLVAASRCSASIRQRMWPRTPRRVACRRWSAFFGRESADVSRPTERRASLVVGNNVLAQVPDLHDFVAGVQDPLRATALPHSSSRTCSTCSIASSTTRSITSTSPTSRSRHVRRDRASARTRRLRRGGSPNAWRIAPRVRPACGRPAPAA